MKSCALIVTFNRLARLKKCVITSVEAGFDVIVIVNNGSTDGTAEWLEDCLFKQIIVLSAPVNTGGAGGFSYGLTYISQYVETEWVFLYDDDAYPLPDILTRFISVKNKFVCDAYCGKVVNKSGDVCKMNLPFSSFPKTIWDEVCYIFDRERFIADDNVYQQVSSFSFVGAILSKSFIARHLSELHPELFIYFDDVYFSYAAWLSGERLLYFPVVTFIHDVENELNGICPEWKVYYLVRNVFLGKFFFKTRSPFGWLSVFFRVVKYSSQVWQQKNKIIYMQYLLQGVLHGLLKKTGRRHG